MVLIQSYSLHGIIDVTLRGSANDFSNYIQKEFEAYSCLFSPDVDQGLSKQSIGVTIGRIPKVSDEMLSLGKGVFLNRSSNKLLLSRDSNTSLYNESEIYASITNVYKEHQADIEVVVDINNLNRGWVYSALFAIYRKFFVFDPRTNEQRLAETFFSQVLEPLLYRCFLDAGWVLLHAAALERDNKVFLVLGPQNIGKTSFTVELTKRGWNMLGDDMCLLNEKGYVLPHPKPLKIENEHFKRDSLFHDEINISRSSLTKFLNPFYRQLVKRFGAFEFKASPSELGIAISRGGHLDSMFFLQRWGNLNDSDLPSVENVPSSYGASLIGRHVAAEVDVNKRLDRDIRHMLALHDKDEIPLSLLSVDAERIIASAASNKSAYILNIHTPDSQAVEKFEDVVKSRA